MRLWRAATSGAALLAAESTAAEQPPGPGFELGGTVRFGADDDSTGPGLWRTETPGACEVYLQGALALSAGRTDGARALSPAIEVIVRG